MKLKSILSYLHPFLGVYFGLLGLLFACNSEPTIDPKNNIIQKGCVENFKQNIDYFPDKIQPKFAQGFLVSYHKHYKVVTVKNPWENATENLEYVLVQCGTPIPQNYPNAIIVEIPTQRVLAMSTTYLPHLEKLGQLEALIGVSDRRLIYSKVIRQRITDGLIQEVGDLEPDVEKILGLKPNVILSYRLDDGEGSRFNTLKSLKQTIVLDAAHLESTPLGRAEWLKFTALLFNKEAEANQEFTAIAQRYQSLVDKTKSLENLPTVLSGSPFQGVWYVPAGNSYVAQFFHDAGADYLWKDSDSRLSLPLDYEAVLKKAKNADFWLNPNQAWSTKSDLMAEDQRYDLLKASQTKQIFIANARLNPDGGNDFWESGATNPDLILADLIKIFHPELLPEHQLYYYRQLN